MKVLIFDIWGDFAHFKKFYTTSSQLTFSFPPPPTIKGILGAIIGCNKANYLRVFSNEKCSIAVQILKPVRKIRFGLNHINTKENLWRPTKKGTHEARTQIPTEFLKNPAYRIYVSHKDEDMFRILAENIKEHKTFFTISLGLSELIADFRYVGILEVSERRDEETKISSVVPISSIIDSLIFKEGDKYFKERVPVDMNPDRVVERYEDVVYESQGHKILLKVQCYWKCEDGNNITFF